jgi:hypothetical protein
MTVMRTILLVVSGLIAVLGLFTLSVARDSGLTVFGWGLLGFGLLFGFSLVKRTFDEAEATRRG